MPRSLRVGIVGFGCAGAASALFLARAGHHVDLYERAESNQPVGAGFLLQPTGMAVLKELGILTELLPLTARVDKLYCRNGASKVMLDLHYGELHPELFGAGTHRPALLGLLEKAVESAGVHLHWGAEIAQVQQHGEQRSLYDLAGTLRGRYDLVIVADGSRSGLRGQLAIPYRHKRYDWGALWFIGKRDDAFSASTLWQAVDSTDRLNGFLPTGTADDLLSLFWSIRMDRVDQWRATPLDAWKAEVLQMCPQAKNFLQQITDHDDLSVAGYHDVVMQRWHSEGAVVVGDAAHALSPQLGQGVNLALVDAQVLATCLAELPLQQALKRYTRERKKHLGFYQHATRWATPFFQSDYALLGAIRDLSFPLANRIPWMRRQMTASMAGLKTGVFSALDAAEYAAYCGENSQLDPLTSLP